ncbi:MAG: UDP-2,3-diacylglucosamine hydrolase [Ignavibacteria bacterium RIFOXYB2_FULL_36_7]|nr:MAG: UDP-2,3-diacylglucosamine hydrolase [Ignavibacteria bacterium RIFOXYB2_FULL_36_7]
MDKTYLFISDVHLGLRSKEEEKQKENLLIKFLQFARENCDELFILGDLFDYWFEYKHVYQKGFFRTLSSLHDLTERGIKIHYIIGNHDFMHRDFFEKEIGVKLYEKDIEAQLNGSRFYLAHGDGLVKNDIGYKILKKILRNKLVQKVYSVIHPDLGIALASRTSKSSRDYTSKKDYGETDGLFEFAKKKIDSGFNFVLLGHFHQRRFKQYKNGFYINLGSWIDEPCYGIFQSNKFEIIDWN